MTVARRLADFLTHTDLEDLPHQAIDHAAMVIASTLASAAAGTNIRSARIIRDMERDNGGRSEASLWFDPGPRLPLPAAARVNAMFSDAAASDDSDLRNIVHAGTPLTAVSLALAERDRLRGDMVLAAVVLGYEAAGRISEAITPGFRERGFHGCLGAIFAACVASARLLKLDAAHMAQAIAIAATSIGGLATAADTSVAREYHAGLATYLGVTASIAAQRGFKAEERILEAPRGFFEAFGGVDGSVGAEIALRDLGQSWDIVTDMAIKLMPGGHPYHALAEAAANAARDGDIAPDQVESITIHRPGMTALHGPLHPLTLIDMAHSPAFFAAAGVADRGLTWAHADPDKIVDPAIQRLIDHVHVGAPPTEDVARYRQGATVSVRALDGRTSTSTVFAPKGAGLLGISWNDIDAKFRTLVPMAGVDAGAIEGSLDMLHQFRSLRDIGSLLAGLQVHVPRPVGSTGS